jgi:hypothetical protein
MYGGTEKLHAFIASVIGEINGVTRGSVRYLWIYMAVWPAERLWMWCVRVAVSTELEDLGC